MQEHHGGWQLVIVVGDELQVAHGLVALVCQGGMLRPNCVLWVIHLQQEPLLTLSLQITRKPPHTMHLKNLRSHRLLQVILIPNTVVVHSVYYCDGSLLLRAESAFCCCVQRYTEERSSCLVHNMWNVAEVKVQPRCVLHTQANRIATGIWRRLLF